MNKIDICRSEGKSHAEGILFISSNVLTSEQDPLGMTSN
jgi:hypothetical protein